MGSPQSFQADDTSMQQLTAWAQHIVEADEKWGASEEGVSLVAVQGDAGFRQYFRVTGVSMPVLAVFAPPATEKNKQFVEYSYFLRERGVRVPEVFAVDFEQGFLLVEDFGGQLLQPSLSDETAQGFYSEVLMALLHIQSIPPSEAMMPSYSGELLRTEMRVFSEWFVRGYLSYEMSSEEIARAEALFDILEHSATSQPQVIVHRDFHSRNILLGTVAGGCEAAGFIDFQDAVVGPITYDVVSLLKDCYVEWPSEQVEQWAVAYGNVLRDAGLIPDMTQLAFIRWFDLMGLQRHIKVLGVFSRLYLRDGKSGYLKDLPLVIKYVRSTLAKYPEFQAFADWFDSVLLPRYLSLS